MLKNYLSKSSITNIFSAIEKSLISHGAKRIVRDFNSEGLVSSISFVITTKNGDISVKLPARHDRVKKIFDEQKFKYKPEQPYRTSWATIRDWVDAQMALIEWDLVKIDEVFLPYMTDKNGTTYFEHFTQNKLEIKSPDISVEEGQVI